MVSLVALAWTLLVALISVAAAAAPIDSLYNISGVHTGVKREASQQLWPARQPINKLMQNVPQWSLFIQALTRLQQEREDYDFSYYQVAGIHGRPYYSWNEHDQGVGAPTTGYCTHGSVLFLSWHRPYLALYEQLIAAIAQDIVKTYPASMQSDWQGAADGFRIPYWDWASTPNMPDVVSQPTVQIINNAGQTVTVNNPLFQYNFQKFPMNSTWFPPGDSDGWLANYPQTRRGVAIKGGPSSPGLANYYMNYYNFQRDTWYTLTRNAGLYNNFSSTATQGSSLEAVHSNVHVAIGAFGGHMSFLSYAAFDPIFWLHHANIDRLYALYQAIYPTSWIQPTSEPYGTFALAPGTPENGDTPLDPFASTGSSPFYTPSGTRLPSVFGYTYPEIPDWNAPGLSASVTAQIHALYNPSNQFKKRASTLEGVEFGKEWFIRIQIDKFALLGQRFSIHIFLGPIPQNPDDWLASPNRIGTTTIFAPPHVDGTPYPDVPAYSEISLVEALNERGVDMEDIGGVTGYLKERLRWKVQKFDRTVVPTEEVPSLLVTVQNEVVKKAQDDTELPTYSDINVVPEITRDQAGGFAG